MARVVNYNYRPKVRLDIRNSNKSSNNNNNNNNIPPYRLLSLSKPCWIVKSESNVWKEQKKRPDPPCVICLGSGRVDCHDCCGRGRTNCIDLQMLPNGEWPKWCKTCGGSGLGYCSRCVGTGEYRYIMGFQFMKRESDDPPNPKDQKVRDFPRTKPAGNLLINDELQDSTRSSS